LKRCGKSWRYAFPLRRVGTRGYYPHNYSFGKLEEATK